MKDSEDICGCGCDNDDSMDVVVGVMEEEEGLLVVVEDGNKMALDRANKLEPGCGLLSFGRLGCLE